MSTVMASAVTGSWRSGPRALRLLSYPETVVVLLVPVGFVVSHLLSPHFHAAYMIDASKFYVETGIMALAMTFVIISGNIDLSVASNLCLTAVVCAELFTKWHMPMAVVVAAAPVIGGLLGLVNGILIAKLRLPSLTVTLGTMALYRGLAQVMVGDNSIGGFPEWFQGIDRRLVGGRIPLPLVIFALMAIVCGIILAKTTFGRRVYAIGTNEAAARYSGIRVDQIKLVVFAGSGVFSGIAAIIMLSRLASASYTMAHDECCSELAVITAVVLGGTDIFGGRGTIFGTGMALFLLAVVSCGMDVAQVKTANQLAVTGALLVAAVILFRLLGTLRRGR